MWAKWYFLYNLIVILQFPRPTIVTVKSFESCHLEHGPLIIRANTLKVSFLNSWKWPLFTFINLVDKTNYYHFLGIAPPMQHHSFFRNSTSSSNWFFRIFLCLFAGVVVDKLPKVHWLFFVEIDWSHWWLFMDNYFRFTFYLNP